MKTKKYFVAILFLMGIVLVLTACSSPDGAQPAATANIVSEPTAAATQAATVDDNPVSEPLATGTQAATGDIPEGWRVYTNSTYGFTFAYPGEWEVCGESENVIQLCIPFHEGASPIGPSPSFYVAVIPQGQNHSGLDFMTAEAVRNYLSLPVGESAYTEPNPIVPEVASYTRLPDIMVAGMTAAVIENQTVWEAPEEINDRRALLAKDAGLFSLGSYYGSSAELQTYEKILSTFAFTTNPDAE